MKKKVLVIGVILIIGVIIAIIYKTQTHTTNSEASSYLKEEKATMDKMGKAMENIENTEDVAIAYLKGMIPHHEGAIEMAESLLKHGGENEKINKIAEDVLKVQQKEIEDMKKLILELEKNPENHKENLEKYLKEYNKMDHNDMTGHGTKYKTVDEAFAKGMILHHQMAIHMSESLLKYSDNKEVKTLAETIIKAQKKEIQEMKNIK